MTLIVSLLSVKSFAEYRVFALKISKKPAAVTNPGPEPTTSEQAESGSASAASLTPDFRLVESTLDPLQYKAYYPVAQDEEISYTETWKCKGRTSDFKPYCPNPKGQIPKEPTASP